MKLKFFNPENLEKNLKATIHTTGKLGFTIEAAKKMQLSPNKSIGISMNEEDAEDKNFYLVVFPDRRPNAFNVNKAGQYYYINTKTLFDNLKLNYKDNTISFDITEEEIGGQTVYKFVKKEKSKKVLYI